MSDNPTKWQDKMMEVRVQYELKRLEFIERKMDMFERSTKRKSYIRLVFASILSVIVIGCLWFLFTTEIPSGNRDVVIALVSALAGAFFGSVISYYFGDSDTNDGPVPSFEEKHELGNWDEEEGEFEADES